MSRYVRKPGEPVEVRQVTDDKTHQEVADWIDISSFGYRDSEFRRILLNHWASDSGDNFWVWENGDTMSDRKFQEMYRKSDE